MVPVNPDAARTPERAASGFFHSPAAATGVALPGTVVPMAVDPITRTFGSLLVAMVTPFTEQGELDLDAAARLATHLVDHGCDGLVVSGTTGESPTTSDAEKETLLRAVLDAVGSRAVVVTGVGTNDTAHSVELAQQAAKAGAHGVLAVTPYYSKPPQAGLIAHFNAIADATDLPVMLYDIPGRSGIPIRTETLVTLAQHPNVVALKDAKGDLYEMSWVLARTDLEVYCGTDELNLAALTCGASGLVSVVAHAAPARFRQLVDAVDAGDLVSARRIHTELLPAIRGLMTRTQGVIMAKAALQLQGVLAERGLRLPLVEATDDEVAVLRADLEEAALLP
jgi:4-hydroxy-tetrahydrodipicolinate synthase